MKYWPIRFAWPLAVCVLHALAITAVWITVFKFELDVMPGKYWLALSLSWFLWPLSIAFAKGEDRTHWIVSTVLGLLILVPTFSTTYTFVVWAVEGFAP